MKREELDKILELHKLWLQDDEKGQRANLWEADLQEANLQEANLWEADLREADLREADLQRADLRRTDLRGANLWEADLREADLREANLQRADLRRTDLRGANLWGADLDFSCWPLWCGSKKVKIDDKLFWQLCDHILVTDTENCSKDVARVKRYLERYGKRSHRAKELDL